MLNVSDLNHRSFHKEMYLLKLAEYNCREQLLKILRNVELFLKGFKLQTQQ